MVSPGVAVGNAFNAFYTDVLRLPLNWDVASEPEKVWKRAKLKLFLPMSLADRIDVVEAGVLSCAKANPHLHSWTMLEKHQPKW